MILTPTTRGVLKPSAISSTPFMLTFSGTSLRTDTVRVGFRFTVNSAITITDLGRIFITGDTGTHNVLLRNTSTSTDIANKDVNVLGGVNGGFVYATLDTPVVLSVGQTYYLSSAEGGDQWWDDWMTAGHFTTPSVATINYSTDSTAKWYLSDSIQASR